MASALSSQSDVKPYPALFRRVRETLIDGQRSYQKRGAYLSVTYNFGANHVVLGDTGRPYRVTGPR